MTWLETTTEGFETGGLGVVSLCGQCGGVIYSLVPTGTLAPCSCFPDEEDCS